MAARMLALGAAMAAAVSAVPQAATTVSSSAAPVYTDACLAQCEATLSDCNEKASIPGNPNHPTCISNFSQCIGYSPFVDGRFVQPTACASVVTTVVTSYTTYCPGPTTIVHNNKTITAAGPTTLTITDCPCTITTTAPAPPASSAASDCLSKCNAAHDACVYAPDANMSFCASKYSECLGYSPWDSGSYVTPTACAAPSTTTGPVVVPTAAAGRVALPGALAALGALAML